jgi:hypothetical protein
VYNIFRNNIIYIININNIIYYCLSPASSCSGSVTAFALVSPALASAAFAVLVLALATPALAVLVSALAVLVSALASAALATPAVPSISLCNCRWVCYKVRFILSRRTGVDTT